jgi:hypothetical protein
MNAMAKKVNPFRKALNVEILELLMKFTEQLVSLLQMINRDVELVQQLNSSS